MVPVVVIPGLGMLAVDAYFILRIGALDRNETTRYLDEAEHWLTSWKSPLIRTLTLGYINPRKLVAVEVKKAVEEGRGLLRRTLWWISAQAGLRTLFGLALWTAWAVFPTPTQSPPVVVGPSPAIDKDPLLSSPLQPNDGPTQSGR